MKKLKVSLFREIKLKMIQEKDISIFDTFFWTDLTSE